MKHISFVVTGHGLMNIILGGSVIILIGATWIIFLLPKKNSPDKVEIFLKKLSKLWIKETNGKIHISELAPIWREEKAPRHDVRNYHFKHEVVVVFEEHAPSSDRALDIALSQAAKMQYQLFVMADSEHAKNRVEQVFERHSGYHVCQLVDLSRLDEVISLLHKHAPALFVLPDGGCLTREEKKLQQMIDSMESDILLVR